MAELLGKSTGVNHGKGGSMHLADFSVGSLGETSIVGAGLPIAVGGGLSARLRGSDQVALCFFGDGAANQGTFHESLNLAAVWKLPVIFLCENNRYALSTPYESTTSIENISDRAVAYGIPGVGVDGMDAKLVYAAVTTAVARARAGDGPSLIEARTYRFTEHAEGLRLKYRGEPEIDAWRARDPIRLLRESLVAEAPDAAGQLDAVDSEVEELILDAVKFARESPVPELSSIYEDLYAMPLGAPAR
jgi:pyruvate dehydrogenase E1 component alpha subunit